jgi:hypothetical protein
MAKKKSLSVRKERRSVPFAADQEKFATQRTVTYILLGVFVGVTAKVFLDSDQAERSTVLQTIINLCILAVGYWMGTSKSGTDQAQAVQRIAESAPTVAAAAVAASANKGSPLVWEVGKEYKPNGPILGPDGKLYVCLVPHTSEDWDKDLAAGKWAPKPAI